MTPGTIGGWLLAYARARAYEKKRGRAKQAAWHARKDGVGGMWARYQAAVKQGMQPVRRKQMRRWRRYCAEKDGKATTGVIMIRREERRVWVTGGDARTRRKVARAERGAGEEWRTEAEPAGGDGDWRRERKRRLGGRVGDKRRRLTEGGCTGLWLARIANGLEEPFGDG